MPTDSSPHDYGFHASCYRFHALSTGRCERGVKGRGQGYNKTTNLQGSILRFSCRFKLSAPLKAAKSLIFNQFSFYRNLELLPIVPLVSQLQIPCCEHDQCHDFEPQIGRWGRPHDYKFHVRQRSERAHDYRFHVISEASKPSRLQIPGFMTTDSRWKNSLSRRHDYRFHAK